MVTPAGRERPASPVPLSELESFLEGGMSSHAIESVPLGRPANSKMNSVLEMVISTSRPRKENVCEKRSEGRSVRVDSVTLFGADGEGDFDVAGREAMTGDAGVVVLVRQ